MCVRVWGVKGGKIIWYVLLHVVLFKQQRKDKSYPTSAISRLLRALQNGTWYAWPKLAGVVVSYVVVQLI